MRNWIFGIMNIFANCLSFKVKKKNHTPWNLKNKQNKITPTHNVCNSLYFIRLIGCVWRFFFAFGIKISESCTTACTYYNSTFQICFLVFFFFSQILKHAILQMDQKVKHTSGRLAQHTFCFLNMSSVTPTLNIGLWSYRACIHCVYLCSPRQTHV